MTKLALITGASAGIGREACALFARKGYRVIALSRQPAGVESADLELALDLESFDQIEGLAGALDTEIAAAERVILVNNLVIAFIINSFLSHLKAKTAKKQEEAEKCDALNDSPAGQA